MEREYDIAFKQARNDDPKGLLKLYELASESPSAEIGYVARDVLHYFLRSKTPLWIKTFSKVNPTEFKKYIETGGLAVTEPSEGIQSEELYHSEIIKNLRNFNGSPLEMELAKVVLGTEEEIYKEITSKK